MSNSSLVNVTMLSPNCCSRTAPIKKITIHHCAGNLSVETIGNIFKPVSRKASSNYGIGTDGRVGLYVNESMRPYTSGTWGRKGEEDNDNIAVTIEVSNDEIGGSWHVSEKAYAKLIDLCVDICKRNGIKQLNWTGTKYGNLTCHYMFQSTACPGPYLKSKMADIARAVNARLGSAPAVTPEQKPQARFPYLVKVATDVLNVRAAAGVINEKTGKENRVNTTVKRGQVYTIVDEVNGWGKLKSGAGYICLAYTIRV